MRDSREVLVESYWRYCRLSQGERPDRLEAADSFWAWEEVEREVEDRDPDLLEMLDELLHYPEADPGYVGAGPIEHALTDHPDLAGDIAARCRRDAAWSMAVRGVWLDAHEYRQLEALHDWLKAPR